MPNPISQTAEHDSAGASDMRRRKRLARIDGALTAHFAYRPDVLVAGGGGVRRDKFDTAKRLAPDCLVAFGVEDPDEIIDGGGYVISEVGKPPDFVLDLAPPAALDADLDAERARYAAYGAREYWRLRETADGRDDDAPPLAGGRLVRGAYAPVRIHRESDGLLWGFSKALGLRVCWDMGDLRFEDPDTGLYLPDAEGLRWRAEAAEALAAIAQSRIADAEAGIMDTRARIADSQARISELESRMEAAEVRLADAEANLAELKKRVEEAEARADAQAASDHIREMMRRRDDS